jgi:hypothetical protein
MPMSEQMRGLISEAVHQVFMYITDNIDTFAEEYALTDEDINNLRNAQELMVVVKDAAAQSVEQVLEQTGGMAPVDPAAYAEPETNSAYEQTTYANVDGAVVEEAEAAYEPAQYQYSEVGSDDVNASAYMHMGDAPAQDLMAGEAVADAEEMVAMGTAEVGVVEETEEDEESYDEDEDEDDEFVDEDEDDDEEDDEDEESYDEDEDEDDEFVDEDEDDDEEDYDEDEEDEDEVVQPIAAMDQQQPVSVGELVNPYDANRAQLLDMLQRSLVDYEFARRLRQFFGIA